MHLVRPVSKSDGARLRVGVGELEVIAQARSAVRLDGPVDHLAGGVRGGDLDRGDLGTGRLVADRRSMSHAVL